MPARDLPLKVAVEKKGSGKIFAFPGLPALKPKADANGGKQQGAADGDAQDSIKALLASLVRSRGTLAHARCTLACAQCMLAHVRGILACALDMLARVRDILAYASGVLAHARGIHVCECIHTRFCELWIAW